MKRAFIFPGQGSQFVGMGRDLYDNLPKAKELFEKADELLNRRLSTLMFDGPNDELKKTVNSQPAIFVMSLAVLSCVDGRPDMTAGLSLGEYTALVASGRLSFEEGLKLVQLRAHAMQEACERKKGTMAAIVGLTADQVDEEVEKLKEPELWVANYNCPGQTVISGSEEAVKRGIEALKAAGARRALELEVSGAFHSGFMRYAQEKLAPEIEATPFHKSEIAIVMNVPGDFVDDADEIRKNLIMQVTSSVRWQQSIEAMRGVDRFIEIGCGKSLTGMNRKMGVKESTSVGTVEELEALNAKG